jgi:hypothetical protein
MLVRVRDRRRVQRPRGTLRDVPINLAGLERPLGAEHGPELWALGDVAGPLDPPHQIGEFLVLRENQRGIARPARRAIGGERLAGGRAFQHHRFVIVGHRGRRGENGPAAHRVALEPDIVLVDDVEAAQVRQPIGSAKTAGEGRWIAVAMAGLVEGEHHVTPAGKFDGKAVLGFPRIDVAVNGENAGGGGLGGRIRRDVEQGAHGVALIALEAHILDPDAAGGLRQMGHGFCEVAQTRRYGRRL